MAFTLLSFTPFQPSPGLALWSLIIFLIFWYLIVKFAFRPIINALEKREADIQNAIDGAKLAREEMAALKSNNEQLLAEAREERAKILQEAKDLKNQILKDAKDQAKEEAAKILTQAKIEIENQKHAAMIEMKNKVGEFAIEIAEKIIRQNLANNAEQQRLVRSLIDDIKLN